MNDKSSNNGFAALEAALILVVIAILGFTGWYVWHSTHVLYKTIAATNKPGEASAGYTTTANADRLKLAAWSVTYTIPSSLRSQLAVQPYDDGATTSYSFSLRAIENNKACKNYLESVNKGDPTNVQVNRAKASDEAWPVVTDSETSLTLMDYYNAHKSSSGNYFMPQHSAVKWWKVGNYFYYASSNPVLFNAILAPDLAKECTDVPTNYQQSIVDAIATLKSY